MAKIKIKPFKKIAAGKIDINDYISEAGLDGLCVLEGHRDAEKVKNMRNNKVEYDWTGLCGITDSAIKEVKQRASEAGITLPKEMMEVTSAKQLGKGKDKLARMYAGYYAWVNDTKMNQVTDGAFSTYTPHQRDVLLSYLHNVDISKLTTGTKGSLIDAIKEHNEDEVIRRIFMKEDGTLADYEQMREQNKRGVANRWMAHMQWWYNPDAEVVKDMKTKENKYYHKDGLYSQKGFMNNLLAANAVLVEDTKNRKNENALNDNNSINDAETVTEQPQQPIAAPKPAQEPSFWEKVGRAAMTALNPFYGLSSGNSNQVAQNEENILNNPNGEKV